MKLFLISAGIVLLPLLSIAGPPSPYPIRLFIVMDHDGFVDERIDSAKDLAKGYRKADDRKSAKDLAMLVPTREEADVIIDIVGRREEVAGGMRARPKCLTARLTAGAHSTEIDECEMSPVGTWYSVAYALQHKIDKFLRTNAAVLAKHP